LSTSYFSRSSSTERSVLLKFSASMLVIKPCRTMFIRQNSITDPFVGYKRQIIMTTENDPELFQDQSELAGKYPDNTTKFNLRLLGHSNLTLYS
jgi:hypothetical protein